MYSNLVSVIIPIYKVEKYLDKCIQSVAQQTYKNLEIILVDDGSPDNCPQMCEEWAKKDSRVKVVHKQNGGLADARNAGFAVCTGEYITFVDSDDWIDSDMIELLLEAIIKNNADVACCDFYYDHLDGVTNIIETKKEILTSDISKNYLLDKIRPEACAKLYSAKCIGDLRFDTTNHYSEDVPYNYYLMKKVSTYVNLGIAKYHYLQNSGNSHTTKFITDARAKSYKVYVEMLNDCIGNDELYKAALRRFTVSTFAILSRVMLDEEIRRKYYNEIVNEILKHRRDIFKNDSIAKKYKLSIIFLSLSRKLFAKAFSLIRKRP